VGGLGGEGGGGEGEQEDEDEGAHAGIVLRWRRGVCGKEDAACPARLHLFRRGGRRGTFDQCKGVLPVFLPFRVET
jgi:hypothetical protein